MYNINDTITAISSASLSASSVARTIIRISGDKTYDLLGPIVTSPAPLQNRGVSDCTVNSDFQIEAKLYKFHSPNSYTGEDLAELHFFASPDITDKLLSQILQNCRLAGPGEFTLRAYLNGKLDLSQAEAVAQIVAGSNKFQLAAAEKLLAGKLCDKIADIRNRILDIMTLLEAGMDFSEEDIEFISSAQASERISSIESMLYEILNGSIRHEELIDMPSVGLAGAANAGKSSLMNSLLKSKRSITSDTLGTTRDILTDILETKNCRSAIFDCAGLGQYDTHTRLLDDLAQQAAVEALNSADLVIFCLDISKDDYSADTEILNQINPKQILTVLTKTDLVNPDQLQARIASIKESFNLESIPVSVTDSASIDNLRLTIDRFITKITQGATEASDRIAINQRHRETVQTAIKNIRTANKEIASGNDELAAMTLRAAYESLAGIEREEIDEKILDRIFSSFCIGK